MQGPDVILTECLLPLEPINTLFCCRLGGVATLAELKSSTEFINLCLR